MCKTNSQRNWCCCCCERRSCRSIVWRATTPTWVWSTCRSLFLTVLFWLNSSLAATTDHRLELHQLQQQNVFYLAWRTVFQIRINLPGSESVEQLENARKKQLFGNISMAFPNLCRRNLAILEVYMECPLYIRLCCDWPIYSRDYSKSEEPAGARFFTGWLPFMSPNQQC